MIAKSEGWDTDTTHQFIKANFFVEKDELLDLSAKLVANEITVMDFVHELFDLIAQTTTTKDLPPSYYEDKFRQIRTHYSHLNIPLPNEPIWWTEIA